MKHLSTRPSVLRESGHGIDLLRFSLDDKTLLSLDTEGNAHLWSHSSGELGQFIPFKLKTSCSLIDYSYTQRPTLATWLNSGEAFVITRGKRLWYNNSQTWEGELHSSTLSTEITALGTRNGDKRLLLGYSDGSIGFYDTIKKEVTSDILFGHIAPITAFTSLPGNEDLVVSSSEDGTIRFWNVQAKELLATVIFDWEGNWRVVCPSARWEKSAELFDHYSNLDRIYEEAFDEENGYHADFSEEGLFWRHGDLVFEAIDMGGLETPQLLLKILARQSLALEDNYLRTLEPFDTEIDVTFLDELKYDLEDYGYQVVLPIGLEILRLEVVQERAAVLYAVKDGTRIDPKRVEKEEYDDTAYLTAYFDIPLSGNLSDIRLEANSAEGFPLRPSIIKIKPDAASDLNAKPTLYIDNSFQMLDAYAIADPAMVLSPDSTKILLQTSSKSLTLNETSSNRVIHEPTVDRGEIEQVAFSPTGKFCAALASILDEFEESKAVYEITVWDVTTGELLNTYETVEPELILGNAQLPSRDRFTSTSRYDSNATYDFVLTIGNRIKIQLLPEEKGNRRLRFPRDRRDLLYDDFDFAYDDRNKQLVAFHAGSYAPYLPHVSSSNAFHLQDPHVLVFDLENLQSDPKEYVIPSTVLENVETFHLLPLASS